MLYKTLRLIGVLSLALALATAGFAPAAGASLPKVALYSAGWSPAYNADVLAKLTGTSMFSQVDNLSPLGCDQSSSHRGLDPTPTLATLQEYAAVLIYSDCPFYDP